MIYKNFELVYKSGPHGDACSSYTIKLKNEQVTIADFVESLPENEWGTIFIYVPDPETFDLPYAAENEKYKKVKIDYDRGTIKNYRDTYNLYANEIIDANWHNWANGGWGAMDYWLQIKTK